MKQLKELSEALLTIIFPTPCQLCQVVVENSNYGVACQRCWEECLSVKPTQNCQRCGNLYHAASGYPATIDCAFCRQLTFSFARTCGRYDGALRINILHLKSNPVLCPRLIELLQATFFNEIPLQESTLIIPVPLHAERLRERGFNQAEIIAQTLANLTDLPVDCDSLIRRKPTPRHRSGMDLYDRHASVAEAFEVVRPRLIDGAKVLLVDDVLTTGSTISACATTLFNARAIQVNVLTLARVSTN